MERSGRLPLAPIAWLRLSLLLGHAGDHEGSRAAAERALEIAPDSMTGRSALGFALLRGGKTAEALEQFQRSPAPVFRLLGIAIASHRLGRARESQAALDELYGLGYDYEKGFSARIQAVTHD